MQAYVPSRTPNIKIREGVSDISENPSSHWASIIYRSLSIPPIPDDFKNEVNIRLTRTAWNSILTTWSVDDGPLLSLAAPQPFLAQPLKEYGYAPLPRKIMEYKIAHLLCALRSRTSLLFLHFFSNRFLISKTLSPSTREAAHTALIAKITVRFILVSRIASNRYRAQVSSYQPYPYLLRFA